MGNLTLDILIVVTGFITIFFAFGAIWQTGWNILRFILSAVFFGNLCFALSEYDMKLGYGDG